MSLVNLVTPAGTIVRLWQSAEPCEALAASALFRAGFPRELCGLRKVDGQNLLDNRTGLTLRWKVYAGAVCLTSYATEPEADTFIRKTKDAINTASGGMGTDPFIKRCADM
jgi:hypothetical protein